MPDEAMGKGVSLDKGVGAVGVYLGTLVELLVNKGLVTREEIVAALDIPNTESLDDDGKAKFALVRRMILRE